MANKQWFRRRHLWAVETDTGGLSGIDPSAQEPWLHFTKKDAEKEARKWRQAVRVVKVQVRYHEIQ